MAARLPSTRIVGALCVGIVMIGIAAVVAIALWTGRGTPARADAGVTTGVAAEPSRTTAGHATASGVEDDPAPHGAATRQQPGATVSPTQASELEPGTSPTLKTQPPPTEGSAPAYGPSLTGPLPPAASARGETLVAGFPSSVVPVLDGIRLVSSAISGEGDRLQIGFQGSTDADPDTVTARYVSTLGDAGFTAGTSPAVTGSTATSFTRGPDGVVLTVTQRMGGGSELSLSGTLTTAG